MVELKKVTINFWIWFSLKMTKANFLISLGEERGGGREEGLLF